MSIKSKAILFRNLLYLNEVIHLSQISAAAEKNGIKASNLSKIIKDLEDITQKQLFVRTNTGLIPTDEAIKISELINQTEIIFNQMIDTIKLSETKKSLHLYTPDNIEIKNLQSFTLAKIVACSSENDADVIISYSKPQNSKNLITVENTCGVELNKKFGYRQ